MLYEELTLPQIPEELILQDPNIVRERRPNIWKEVPTTVYTQHTVNNELVEFLQPYFDFELKIRYQVLEHNVPIHKDIGRVAAINYLLFAGGDNVVTRWYEDDKETVKFEKQIPLHTWHKIDTTVYHGIHGIEDKRLALTISLHS